MSLSSANGRFVYSMHANRGKFNRLKRLIFFTAPNLYSENEKVKKVVTLCTVTIDGKSFSFLCVAQLKIKNVRFIELNRNIYNIFRFNDICNDTVSLRRNIPTWFV